MAKRKVEFDILSAEGMITDIIAEMKKRMETVKQEISKGTQVFDALRKEPKGTVKKSVVDMTQDKIRTAIDCARYHWDTSKEALIVLDEQIRKEINSSSLTSVRYMRLKKLQAKNLEAKQKLLGFNVDKMQESGNKVIAQISRAYRQHFYNM